MERVQITHPNRKTLPHDVHIHYISEGSDDINTYFPAHRIMVGHYPYFSGVLSDLSVNDIYLPFSKDTVDKLLDLIYEKTWNTWSMDINELNKLLSYVGIYNDKWFNDEFKKANYVDACEYLTTYGEPQFIRENDDIAKYKYLRKHYSAWTNEENEARLFAKYMCCVREDKFYEYKAKLSDEYDILRYICLSVTEPDSEAHKKLRTIINESRHGKHVTTLPNYKCLRTLHKYKHYSSRRKKSLYNDFIKIIFGEQNKYNYKEIILEDPEINSSSSSEEIRYVSCYGGDDGW